MSNLTGRTALITGSTSGIGRAVAEALAAAGAEVVITGRRAQLGEETVAAIRSTGGKATYIQADLSNGKPEIEALAAAAGRLDILVNNAAYLAGGAPTLDTTEAVIDATLATNIKSPYLLTAAVARDMLTRGTGVIINIGSINALTGMSGAALYGASKAALHAMTQAWAAEFGPAGIRVNTIAPGPTVVEWSKDLQPRLKALVSGTPAGRMAHPEEIAAVAVFLAGDAASHIHGATIPVDGGLTTTTPSITAP